MAVWWYYWSQMIIFLFFPPATSVLIFKCSCQSSVMQICFYTRPLSHWHWNISRVKPWVLASPTVVSVAAVDRSHAENMQVDMKKAAQRIYFKYWHAVKWNCTFSSSCRLQLRVAAVEVLHWRSVTIRLCTVTSTRTLVNVHYVITWLRILVVFLSILHAVSNTGSSALR